MTERLGACPHYPDCGGCTLQHLPDPAYAADKHSAVTTALARAGFDAALVGPLVRTPQAARRRAVLAMRRRQGGVTVGLHRHRSHDVVDLHTCLVLHPALVALIPALRGLPLDGLRREATATANLLDNGIDLLLRTDAALSPADRSRLAAWAPGAGCSRISHAIGTGPAETACQLDTPVLAMAGQKVTPPPGAFLQASREGEAAIAEAVLAGLPPKLPARGLVIELYAGCGTLSFPLALHARVQAIEGDPAALAALRHASTGTKVTPVLRDLARQPLAARELSLASAIVLDPPFAGAAPQMRGIAQSGVPRVIYVSCNPVALARDGAVLREAGFALERATPIDQFLWSANVECVAVFSRCAPAARRR